MEAQHQPQLATLCLETSIANLGPKLLLRGAINLGNRRRVRSRPIESHFASHCDRTPRAAAYLLFLSPDENILPLRSPTFSRDFCLACWKQMSRQKALGWRNGGIEMDDGDGDCTLWMCVCVRM